MTHSLSLRASDFASFSENEFSPSNIGGSVATRHAAGDFSGFMGMLGNPDPVLRAMGKNITAYKNLLSDPWVLGLRRRRISAVVALKRGFHPDGCKQTPPQVLKACNILIDSLDVASLIRNWMDGAFFGYRVSEVMWAKSNGRGAPGEAVPSEVITKPNEWFGFHSETSELLFKPKGSASGLPVPERKFVVVGRMRNWENPYGEPDLAACFWPITFKRGGMKFWMTFTEKYGMPWAVGKLSREAPQSEVDDLADKLDQMVRDAVAVVPDDSSVSFISVKSDQSAELYERFLKYCNSEVSIALLGNNQSVEAESNRASATAARGVEAFVRDDDAAMVADGFNQVVRMYCAVNYPGARPPVYRFWEQAEIDVKRATRDGLLAESGAVFTNEYFEHTYGLQPGDLEPPPLRKVSTNAAPAAKPAAHPNAKVRAESMARLFPKKDIAQEGKAIQATASLAQIVGMPNAATRQTATEKLRTGLLEFLRKTQRSTPD